MSASENRPNKAIDLAEQLSVSLRPYSLNPAFERLILELLWIKQQIESGELTLPVHSTQDLFLSYVVGEDLLDGHPQAKQLANQLMDTMFDI